MSKLTFYDNSNPEDAALSKALANVLNEEQANRIMTTVAQKLFPEKMMSPDNYPMGATALATFLPQLQDQNILDDPHNTSDMLFAVYQKAGANLSGPNPILNDTDIKGMELVIKRVLATTNQSPACTLKTKILSAAKSSNIEFGRTI